MVCLCIPSEGGVRQIGIAVTPVKRSSSRDRFGVLPTVTGTTYGIEPAGATGVGMSTGSSRSKFETSGGSNETSLVISSCSGDESR